MKMHPMLLLLLFFSLYLCPLHRAAALFPLGSLGKGARGAETGVGAIGDETRVGATAGDFADHSQTAAGDRAADPNVPNTTPVEKPDFTKPTSPELARARAKDCKRVCVNDAKLSVDAAVVAVGGHPTSCDDKVTSGIIETACDAACVGAKAAARATPKDIAEAAEACADKAKAPSADTPADAGRRR